MQRPLQHLELHLDPDRDEDIRTKAELEIACKKYTLKQKSFLETMGIGHERVLEAAISWDARRVRRAVKDNALMEKLLQEEIQRIIADEFQNKPGTYQLETATGHTEAPKTQNESPKEMTHAAQVQTNDTTKQPETGEAGSSINCLD